MRKAFTLIETVVFVAVLALLVWVACMVLSIPTNLAIKNGGPIGASASRVVVITPGQTYTNVHTVQAFRPQHRDGYVVVELDDGTTVTIIGPCNIEVTPQPPK